MDAKDGLWIRVMWALSKVPFWILLYMVVRVAILMLQANVFRKEYESWRGKPPRIHIHPVN